MKDSGQRPSLDFVSIVETFREPLLALDADLQVRKANAAFYRVFELRPEEIIGRAVYDLFDRQRRIPALRELLESVVLTDTELHDLEVVHDFPTVGPKTILINARRVADGSHLSPHILLALEDFTENTRSRHFNFSNDLLCVATLEGFFVDVNPSFELVLGYSREKLLGRPFYEFIHPEDKEKTATAVQRLGQGQDLAHFRNRYRCKDGSYRCFDWTCPAPRPGERYLYSAARDITDLLLIEAERNRLHSELVRSNADLDLNQASIIGLSATSRGARGRGRFGDRNEFA